MNGDMRCPECDNAGVSHYMSAGEAMDPEGFLGGMADLLILPDVPDILKCDSCGQIFDTKGRKWREEDFYTPKN